MEMINFIKITVFFAIVFCFIGSIGVGLWILDKLDAPWYVFLAYVLCNIGATIFMAMSKAMEDM